MGPVMYCFCKHVCDWSNKTPLLSKKAANIADIVLYHGDTVSPWQQCVSVETMCLRATVTEHEEKNIKAKKVIHQK